MPIIKSAIKKMRQDARRRIVNKNRQAELKKVVKMAAEKPSSELIGKAFSALDKATKKGLIHKNTAGRKKSALAKKLEQKPRKSPKSKVSKKISKR